MNIKQKNCISQLSEKLSASLNIGDKENIPLLTLINRDPFSVLFNSKLISSRSSTENIQSVSLISAEYSLGVLKLDLCVQRRFTQFQNSSCRTIPCNGTKCNTVQ